MESGRLRIQFQRFGTNFADRWPRWTGARLIEVHLHSKSFGGTLKWPLKGGSRLIQVTATAGLTVLEKRSGCGLLQATSKTVGGNDNTVTEPRHEKTEYGCVSREDPDQLRY